MHGPPRITPLASMQSNNFDIAAEIAALTEGRGDIGAVVAFTGLCRNEGGTLAALELEHYPGMAEGEIARIAGALGSAGINIEDLAMRHASAADRGSLLLRVRATDIDRATSVLGDAGMDGVLVESDPATPVASAGEQR